MKNELLKSYRRKDPLIIIVFLFLVAFFLFFQIDSLEKNIGRYESKTNTDISHNISNYFGNLKLGEDYESLKDAEAALTQKVIAETNQNSSGLEILHARILYDEKVLQFGELGREIEPFYPGDPDLYINQNSELERLGYGYAREDSYDTPMQALHKLSTTYVGVPAILFFIFIFVLIMKEVTEEYILEKTVPISWSKILVRKFLLFLFYTVIYIAFFCLIVFIVYYFKERPLGQFDYPVLITKTGSISKIWKVVLVKQLYFVLYLLAALSVLYMILKIVGDMRVSLAIITIILYMVNIQSQNAIIDIYSFSPYLSIENGWLLTQKSPISILIILMFIFAISLLNYSLRNVRFGILDVFKSSKSLNSKSLVINDLINKMSGSLVWIILFSLCFGIVVDQVSRKKYISMESQFISALKNDVMLMKGMKEYHKDQTLGIIQDLKDLKKTEASDKETETMNKLLPHLQNMYNDSAEKLVAYYKKSPEEFYKQQIKTLDIAANKDTYNLVVDRVEVFSYRPAQKFNDAGHQYAKTQLEYMKERALTPTNKSLEVFDFYDGSEVVESYDMSGIGYFVYVYRRHFILVVILSALILTGGSFTKRNKDDNSELFYNLMPIKKWYIYMISWVSSVLKSSVLYVSIQLLPFLVISGIYGIGDGRYPVLNYMGISGNFEWMPRSEVMLKYFTLGLIILLFLQSISNLLSTRIKNNYLNSMFTVSIASMGYYIGKDLIPLEFNPFLYLNPGDIVNNKYASQLQNINITYYMGCITLILGSIVLLIIGCILYSKKERRRV